jgi:hypothetical protein
VVCPPSTSDGAGPRIDLRDLLPVPAAALAG